MSEHFPQQDHNNDIAKRIEIQKAQAEFIRARQMEEIEAERMGEPGNLSSEGRQALRDMLVEAGVKVNMYEQFQNSVNPKKKAEETKDAIMRTFDEEKGPDSIAA